MSDKEKELTDEELEKATGGIRVKRGKGSLGEAGKIEPREETEHGPVITAVEPLDDPPFRIK